LLAANDGSQSLLVICGAVRYNGAATKCWRDAAPVRLVKDAAMQRIAAATLSLILGSLSWSAALGQIIQAQPAQQPLAPALPPALPPASYGSPALPGPTYSPPNYSTPAYTSATYGQPSALTSLLQSPEANTIRRWYRDYLGRDAGQDLGALVSL